MVNQSHNANEATSETGCKQPSWIGYYLFYFCGKVYANQKGN